MNCFFCAKKISKSEITKRFRDAGVSQCSRWMYMYKCDNCNKIWSTCCNCPKLLENIKYIIGEYKEHNNIDYFICYKCYEN